MPQRHNGVHAHGAAGGDVAGGESNEYERDAEGLVITQVMPPYDRTDLPTVKLYREALEKYMGNTQPTFVSLEGFVDAMVVVEALRSARRELTREGFLSALESVHRKDIGLGPGLQLSFSPTRHKGLDSVYVTVVKAGRPVVITDWNELPKDQAHLLGQADKSR